jgi:hypothetical protein
MPDRRMFSLSFHCRRGSEDPCRFTNKSQSSDDCKYIEFGKSADGSTEQFIKTQLDIDVINFWKNLNQSSSKNLTLS